MRYCSAEANLKGVENIRDRSWDHRYTRSQTYRSRQQNCLGSAGFEVAVVGVTPCIHARAIIFHTLATHRLCERRLHIAFCPSSIVFFQGRSPPPHFTIQYCTVVLAGHMRSAALIRRDPRTKAVDLNGCLAPSRGHWWRPSVCSSPLAPRMLILWYGRRYTRLTQYANEGCLCCKGHHPSQFLHANVSKGMTGAPNSILAIASRLTA